MLVGGRTGSARETPAMTSRRLARALAPLTLALLATACGDRARPQGDGAQPSSDTHDATPASQDDLRVRLAAADRLDGSEDQVVHRCVSCNLHMDGSAEHAVTVDGYTLHLCSEACRARTAADPREVVMTAQIEVH